jgi:F-type H+-transporting ATPase subunit gamma
MASGKDIKRRIKSIKNTGKITRAMEMVSAAKMRKAVASVLQVREYAHSAWSILTNLSRIFEKYNKKLAAVREVKSVLAILVTSNRGLCGSFNSQIYRKVREEVMYPEKLKINRVGTKKLDSSVPNDKLKIDFIAVGRKGESMIRKMQKEIIASFPESMSVPKMNDAKIIAKIAMDEYIAEKYDKVVIFYTDYLSTIKQETRVRQIIPISKIDLEKQIAEMDVLAKTYGLNEPETEYKIEPNPAEVLNSIFPRLIEMQIFHAILESNASKEASRMLAMRNATDAANEMSDDLTLAYNQIRQMKITQEIAEISAGRAALES